MIGDWLAQLPALVAAIVVVLAPGLLIGAGLRLRGLALWALAPVGSTVVVAGLALAYGFTGIPWTIWSVIAGCLGLAALAWLGGRFLGPRTPRPAPHRRALWLLAAGLAIGIAFTAARFIVYVPDPTSISQTNDAVFHLNALRYILETQSASSMQLSGVIGARGFYPGAWHGLASAVILSSGAEIAVAANMVSLVIAAVVWPLGIAWFTQQAAHGSLAAAPIAAALAGSLHVFPLLMFQWGVLYPFALSVALLPAVTAVVIVAPRWIRGDGPLQSRVGAWVLIGLLVAAGVGALALSQPAALLAWAIVGMCSLLWWAILHRKGDLRHRMRVGTVVVVAAVVFAGLWLVLTAGTTGAHWPPFRGKLEVLVDVLLNGHVLLAPAVGVGILTLIGVVVALRRRSLRWLATAWMVFTFLYVVVAAVGQPLLRRWLLGAFYADPYRMAALIPLTAIPLAAIGLAAVATWATAAISARRGREAELFGATWSLIAVAGMLIIWFAVAPIIQMRAVTQDTVDAESRYVTTDYLSDDERALLERLDESVAEDEMVIGNPSTGMGFGYMLSGSDVFPRTWSSPRSAQWATIEEGLRDAAGRPDVCDALAVYGEPEFVLDFGEGEDLPGRYLLPGMTDFEGQPGFELVDEEGDASLWRITACAG